MRTNIKLTITLIALALPLAVLADVPTNVNFQGRVTGLNGAPLFNDPNSAADGRIDLKFQIFDALTGGASQWSQTSNNVPVFNGLFSVILDGLDTTVFPLTDKVNRWLQVEVSTNAGVTFTPLSPRKEIVSVPYALQAANADTLDGKHAAELTYTGGDAIVIDANRIIRLNYSGADFQMTNGALMISDRWVDVAGDTMSGDLAMGAGTTIKGSEIIGSQEIKNGAIINADINTNADIAATKIAGEAVVKTTEFSGMITGRWNNLTISNDVVTTAMIRDGTITNADISPTANIAASKILVGQLPAHGSLSVQTHVSNLWGTVGFVVGQTGREPYSSVQAAINAAVSNGFGRTKPATIEVKPGVYTESLRFATGIYVKAEIEAGLFSVTIVGTHNYTYDDVNNLGDFYISGIEFRSPSGAGSVPLFTIAGRGRTSIRMNDCVLTSQDSQQPALRLANTYNQGGKLSNLEMFHCRIRNWEANFTGTMLVDLQSGSLLMKGAEATLAANNNRSFLAGGASQLILDNAEIKGRIETANGAYLQLSQSSIDSGNQPCIAHNSANLAIVLEAFFISTKSGDVVTGYGPFFYNNIVFYYAAVAGIDQTLASTLTGGSSALPLSSAKQSVYQPTLVAAADWTEAVGFAPPNVSEALNLVIRGDYIWRKELDPWFRASPAYGITAGHINNWNTAYAWGNHGAQGYFKADGSVAATGDFNLGGKRVINAAYMGVGTISPAEKLHVVGNTRIDGTTVVAALTLGGVTRINWPIDLLPENNLSDLPDKAAARANLGLGSAATYDAGAFLTPSGNGSQLSGITASQVGALTPTGNGAQLTGITASQVGALSTNGGVVNGPISVNGAISLVASAGDIPMGVFTNQ